MAGLFLCFLPLVMGQFQLPIPYQQQQQLYPQIYRQPPVYYQQPVWSPYLPQMPAIMPNQNIPVSIIDVDDGFDQKSPTLQDPYANIPTEIIDTNAIMPDVYVPTENDVFNKGGNNEKVVIVTQKPVIIPGVVKVHESTHNSTSGGSHQSYHLVEHKPIQSVIRRVITSNGRDGNKVINIHLVNGVEVTTTTEAATTAATENKEEETQEDSTEEEKDDGVDPKPILSWFG